MGQSIGVNIMSFITTGSLKEPKRKNQCQYDECKRKATFTILYGQICDECVVRFFIKKEIDSIEKSIKRLRSLKKL